MTAMTAMTCAASLGHAKGHDGQAGPSVARGVTVAPFGQTPAGEQVQIFTLTNARGSVAKVMTYGATLTELSMPDRNGRRDNVVLGFASLAPYLARQPHPYFGAIIGRVANRIGGASFVLEGKTYHTPANDGPNTLHGGAEGFDHKLWRAQPVSAAEGPAVAFDYVSPDGDQGFPGQVQVRVVYTLLDQDELQLTYLATTDRPTPVNLTHHSYFNLKGAGQGTVLSHEVRLSASRYTPVDAGLLPTGAIAPVAGTPYDFTTPAPIGPRLQGLHNVPRGFDINYVLDKSGRELTMTAEVYEPGSGRALEVWTTEPDVQFYTGNFLDGTLHAQGGLPFVRHGALCLEAQHPPDALHHANFPSIVLQPGDEYRQTTLYRFKTR